MHGAERVKNEKSFEDEIKSISHQPTFYKVRVRVDFWPMFPFKTPLKHQKTFGFLVFSGVILYNGQIDS